MVFGEFDYRMLLWEQLIEQGGPHSVKPQALRQLGIYGGAQGVWVDKSRTAELTPANTGVTVGLLHKGNVYVDDLSDEGILYHYPDTRRPESRDIGEIDATKAAGQLRLPVFVITQTSPASTRDVYLGWVHGWDDDSKLFLILFDDAPPHELLLEPSDDAPFELLEAHQSKLTIALTRPRQQRFRFLVFQRYGPRCAVCGVEVPTLLDAVHITPRSEGGTDDARNGLVLCALHHRAFDANLFAIDPDTFEIVCDSGAHTLEQLRITRKNITHLDHKPHYDALKWNWNQWERC